MYRDAEPSYWCPLSPTCAPNPIYQNSWVLFTVKQLIIIPWLHRECRWIPIWFFFRRATIFSNERSWSPFNERVPWLNTYTRHDMAQCSAVVMPWLCMCVNCVSVCGRHAMTPQLGAFEACVVCVCTTGFILPFWYMAPWHTTVYV